MLALLFALLAAPHPSLFFAASDVPSLREAAGTTHASIATHLTTILNAHLSDPAPTPTDYGDFRFLGNQVAVWAFGYQLTGDTRYAAMARMEMLTYASWSDWSNGEIASGTPDLAEAHMLLGNAVAYDWIYETLSDADRSTLATKLGLEAQKVADALPTAWWISEYTLNHNWIDTAGLGMVALALQGEDARAPGWLSLVQPDLESLRATIGQIPDGSWHEGLPYEGYGLSMALPFWMALRRAGTDYTDMGLLRGYGLMFLYAGIPDVPKQVILAFGDFTNWPSWQAVQISRYGASRFGDPWAQAAAQRYVATASRPGTVPELWYEVFEFIGYDPSVPAGDPRTLPLDGSFADMGLAALHSTWSPGDLALGFKAGVYGGFYNFNRLALLGSPAGGWLDWGHDHNDDMSFWLFGNGVWLAPEAMGYDAGKSTNYQYPANQTAYHNAILVDGQGQLGDVRASDSNWNNPWFFSRIASPLFTPTGTARYAIAGGAGAQLFASTLGITRWDRVVVLARGRYALVHDDIEASAPHAYGWLCHFTDGASVDTASGWVQGIAKNAQSLGVKMIAPASWTATTGTQTAQLMKNFDPDALESFVQVQPSANVASTQFLAALVPIATAQWASRTPVVALDAADVGAGAVVAPGTALEERWIFARPGAPGKTAGDLVLTGSRLGMAARDATGSPAAAVLFAPGSIADQGGTRVLLSTQSADSIEARISGATLAVTGNAIHDFQAYAPSATGVTLNGVAVAATFESGIVTYRATADGGSPDAGDLCGNCEPPADGGANPALDGGTGSGGEPGLSGPTHGCSHSGQAFAWLSLLGAAALWARRRRAGT